MATFELDSASPELHFPPQLTEVSQRVHRRNGLESLRDELDDYFAIMQKFESMDPTEVMFALSAMSARASEMRFHVVRQDNRMANSFRTKEVEPFLEECERQFKIHSRIATLRALEWDMSKGQA